MEGASLMREVIKECAYGVLPPGDSYGDTLPIIFVRATELKPNLQIDFSSCHRVAQEYFVRKARIKKGDVLLAVKGATIASQKCVAVIEGEIADSVVNGSIFRMQFKKTVLPKFAAVVLDSPILKKQMRLGLVANNGVDYLDKSLINRLVFPVPTEDKQHIVVALYDNASCNFINAQQQAAKLLASIDEGLLAELGINLPSEPKNTTASRIFSAKRRELTGWRFDPQALHPEREACIAELQCKPTVKLWKAARFCRDLRTEIPEGANYIGLENVESNTGRYVPSTDKESVSSAFSIRKGQILFPKLRPYLNKVFLAPFDGLCSTEFHVLEGIALRSDFLALFLRSQIVVKQTKHLMSGNTLPRLQTEDIEDLLVPIVDPETQERVVTEAIRKNAEAERLFKQAESDLDHVKSQIEAMLLGDEA